MRFQLWQRLFLRETCCRDAQCCLGTRELQLALISEDGLISTGLQGMSVHWAYGENLLEGPTKVV